MKGGNSAAVAVRRVDRRRIRDRVNGGDNEQQANQTYGIFACQGVLEPEKAIPLASIPFHRNNDITFRTRIQRALLLLNLLAIPPDRGVAPQ
jgi:hypothetical protein